MIEAFLVALVACAALVYAAAPLRRPTPDPGRGDARLDDALEQRRAAFAALADLEDERAVGKLSEADFESLRREYEAEALAALEELDALEAVSSGDLEAEIARLRREMECPSCGALRTPGEACERCGTSG
ncbi:MAG TPA: hypothetical protein VM573_08730 [Actinomycetota bacterium]|jgi:hypothetical protein|nr:hypothetical protein [Actinomycetota bacterium]